jgi:hypothetical protein
MLNDDEREKFSLYEKFGEKLNVWSGFFALERMISDGATANSFARYVK